MDNAIDEVFYWHDQCMTRKNVNGLNSAAFDSAFRELNIRVERVKAHRIKYQSHGG